MNYNNALDFIHSLSKFGSKPGLDTISELTKRIGNPQQSLKFVHVAGTNGKGSITTLLASILRASGYKTGAYISPFVDHFCERISVNGQAIPESDLTRLIEKISVVCDDMVKDGFSHPTEFEVITAAAFLYFKNIGCDYVILEVGLGGRLDATNIIDSPLCSVITSISFDHMSVLGNTLAEIAKEKCGIIKKGCPCVVYPEQESEVFEVIKAYCEKMNSDIHIAKMPEIFDISLNGTYFSYEGYERLCMPLIGRHMAKNAATALCCVDVLRKSGIDIPENAVYEGFSALKHPGRMEKISEKPLIITDGAHNISGMKAFYDSVTTLFEGKKISFIMGMLKDKEYKEAVEMIADIPERFITVSVPSPRTLSADELAFEVKKHRSDVISAESIEDALTNALQIKPDVVCIFGSLYLLGEFKKFVKDFKEF